MAYPAELPRAAQLKIHRCARPQFPYWLGRGLGQAAQASLPAKRVAFVTRTTRSKAIQKFWKRMIFQPGFCDVCGHNYRAVNANFHF